MFRLILVLMVTLLPLMAGAAPPPTRSLLPESNPTYLLVRNVFTRLARVANRVPPQLHVIKAGELDKKTDIDVGLSRFTPIRVNETEKYVAMDEGLVDLLSTLGSEKLRDNALAFLLGHELAHYAAHESGDFAADRSGSMLKETCEKMKQKPQRDACLEKLAKSLKATDVEREAQADRMGAWYAMEAGYDPFPAAELAIKAIYERYFKNSPPSNYPPMMERIKIINQVRNFIGQKQPFYDSAVLLMTLGRYEEAGRIFGHMATDFQSRELLNNAGVAFTLAALAMEQQPKFHYPLELEATYRYPARARGDDDELQLYRIGLLAKAADFMDRALHQEPEYTTAHLNRACVAELQGTRDEFIFHMNKARGQASKAGDKIMLARLQILEGIDLARQGNKLAAAELFTVARSKAESMAISNLLAIGVKPENLPIGYVPDNDVKETIANVSPGDLARRSPEADSRQLGGIYATAIKIWTYTDKRWSGTKLQADDLIVYTLSTLPDSIVASKREVRIGDNDGVPLARYGIPDRIIATRDGWFYFYDHDSIIFNINRDKKVAGWTIFRSEVIKR